MNIRVLIVEDNKDYRDLLDFYLSHKGFDVLIAENGLDAIDVAAKEKPHIILMDLNLPILDGWEATRIISRNKSTAKIPIIAVSANCGGEMGEEALTAGALGCIQKPFDIEILPDLILSYALNETR